MKDIEEIIIYSKWMKSILWRIILDHDSWKIRLENPSDKIIITVNLREIIY